MLIIYLFANTIGNWNILSHKCKTKSTIAKISTYSNYIFIIFINLLINFTIYNLNFIKNNENYNFQIYIYIYLTEIYQSMKI